MKLSYRAIDTNEGAFTTVHGQRHGTPHRYEVFADGESIGYVYKIENNVIGATYILWQPEETIGDNGDRLPVYSTRRQAAEALVAEFASA